MQTKALLVGEDIAADALGNLANPDKIGNPDNLKFSEKLRTLFIGEDSGYHVNNFLWAYNVDTKALARVMSRPTLRPRICGAMELDGIVRAETGGRFENEVI